MILIRFAVSMFALSLLGLALSLSGAQSAHDDALAPAAIVIAR